MAYKIEFLPYAVKQLAKLDKTAQRRIVAYLENRVAEDPRSHGKGLTGDLAGCWRYRIGDYRAVCDIQEERITVLVLKVGHRRDVYD